MDLPLLERTRIYATDVNERVLQLAHNGIYPIGKVKEYSKNYLASGGKATFSEYYQARDAQVTINHTLAKNIVWAQHNLVTDASFNEFHLIFCRNVLFYFNEYMQERIHRLIDDSLISSGGLLILGPQEVLGMMPYESSYMSLDNIEKIYKKIR